MASEKSSKRISWGRLIVIAFVICFFLQTSVLAEEGEKASFDWKAEANARIDKIRKRNIEIIVVDRLGIPVMGAQVQADQTKHNFAFGSCINTNALNNPQYADFFINHFEWATFENESKWFVNEPYRDYETYMRADNLYEFCLQNNIKVRGHNIFWAKEEYTPPWCRDLPSDELRGEVDERLDSAVNHFKGKFLHWDVNNEMLDGDFYRRKLGPEIEPYMFSRTHEIDPDVKTFTNEYDIIAGSEARTNQYIQMIRNIEAQGGPVHCVGVQGHFWGDIVDPNQILARLDQLSVLNKSVWVTEYDTVDSDENGRADKLENLYRSAFSHPIVDGILMWGFWAGSHWRGADAAIVDQDWTLNAAGERYEALMAEWTTHASGTTNPEGWFSYRGFHGTYVIDVQAGTSHPALTTVQVLPGEGSISFMIPLKPNSCFAAGEVQDLRLEHDHATGITALTWKALPWRADMVTMYDVIRSSNAADFINGAACLESDDGSDTSAIDTEAPPEGGVFFYLIRGEYDCPKGEGPLGNRSDGTAREGRNCP